MKLNYTIAPGMYLTAFFSIENGKLFAAYGDEEKCAPIFPVVKDGDERYLFLTTVKPQKFVNDILNSMWIDCAGLNKEFNIVLRGKETCVLSNGTLIFAAGKSMEAVHFATKQIYENLDQFKKLYFTRYYEELDIKIEKIVQL